MYRYLMRKPVSVAAAILAAGMYLCSPAGEAWAAVINLSLSQKSVDDKISIDIVNDSTIAVDIKSVDVELDRRRYKLLDSFSLLPAKRQTIDFKVQLPHDPGSYPLMLTVRYLNDDTVLSLRHMGLFHFRNPGTSPAICTAETASIRQDGTIMIRSANPGIWSVIVPEEIKVISSETYSDYKLFHVQPLVQGFNVNYPFFGLSEATSDNKHYAALCTGILHVDTTKVRSTTFKGRISNAVLMPLSLLFLAASCVLLAANTQKTRLNEALGKYTSRMFLISASYLLLKNIERGIESSLQAIPWDVYQSFGKIALDDFRGLNYGYFFQYVVDLYFLVSLIMLLPYLYYRDAATPLDQDKYASFTRSILSLKNAFGKKKLYWSKHSKLGFLTYCVKLFYIPLLTSWVINNTIHQHNLNATFHWDLDTINTYLVALFIYIDTIVYCIGYLIEFSSLNNIIRTVEPTVFGWAVCLWCYPPFNAFSFSVFDYPIIDISHSYPQWVHLLITCSITILWGIFAWASVALGFKASNLTNRGIVKTGPYRFIRHPAYAAKLLLWYLQGIFLGQFTVGIMLGFTLIYVLRAWTEERHLSLDPDYVQYKQEVRGAFIPRFT